MAAVSFIAVILALIFLMVMTYSLMVISARSDEDMPTDYKIINREDSND